MHLARPAPHDPAPREAPLGAGLPPGLLDVPFVQDRTRILRFEAGLLLDLHLRRLARLSGAVDRAVALRLRRLRAARGYVRLGFALFRDYVRERLGVAERTGQELARLGEGLERLPPLDAALAVGEITWTAAAQVARVAGVGDVDRWVDLARRVPVSRLRRLVRQSLSRREGSGGPVDRPGGDGPEEEVVDPGASAGDGPCRGQAGASAECGPCRAEAGALDGDSSCSGRGEGEDAAPEESEDPLLRLALDGCPGTAHVWDASLDLCELVAGAEIGPGEGPELVLADYLSGAPALPEGHPPALPRGAPVVFGPQGTGGRGRGSDGGGDDDGAGESADPSSVRPVADLGPAPLPASFAAELKQIEDAVAAPVPRDPFEIDDSMRRLVARRRGLDLDLARLLRNFVSLRLAQHLGFAGFREYAEERLGISARRASRLVGLDRRLFFFARVERAVRDGSIGVEAAGLLCLVATPGQTEDVWIDRARRRAVARLREEVRWVQRQARMTRDAGPLLPPPAGRLPNALEEVSSALGYPVGVQGEGNLKQEEEVSTMGKSACEGGGAGLEAESAGSPDAAVDGKPSTNAPTFAGPDGDARLRAALDDLSRRGGEDAAPVRVEFKLRRSAVDMWNEARDRIAASTGQSFVSDAEVMRRVAVEFLATHLPLWFHEVVEGDPVAVRDRFRCQVPGCTVCGGSAHHVRFRSQLGPDEMWNLLFLCYLHHVPGVHRRCIRISGRVPDRVVYQLGIRPDGTALETFVNDDRKV